MSFSAAGKGNAEKGCPKRKRGMKPRAEHKNPAGRGCILDRKLDNVAKVILVDDNMKDIFDDLRGKYGKAQ
jgi:hypothetical protein